MNPFRLLSVAAVVLAAGCGSSTCTVSGTVTFEGAPLTSGSVVLYGEDDGVYTGLIGPDGSYSVANVPKGALRVTVRAHTGTPRGFQVHSPEPVAHNGPRTAPATPAAPDRVIVIPDRYGAPDASGLVVAVGHPTTGYDIRLTR